MSSLWDLRLASSIRSINIMSLMGQRKSRRDEIFIENEI
mgnify:CR=1 FL=1